MEGASIATVRRRKNKSVEHGHRGKQLYSLDSCGKGDGLFEIELCGTPVCDALLWMRAIRTVRVVVSTRITSQHTWRAMFSTLC